MKPRKKLLGGAYGCFKLVPSFLLSLVSQSKATLSFEKERSPEANDCDLAEMELAFEFRRLLS